MKGHPSFSLLSYTHTHVCAGGIFPLKIPEHFFGTLVFHTPTCVTVFVRKMTDKWENRGFLKGQEGFGANY